MAYLNWTVVGYKDGTFNIMNNKDKSLLTFTKKDIKEIIELLQDMQDNPML